MAGVRSGGRPAPVIDGVVLQALTTHADQRGFFREVCRLADDLCRGGIGQISHTLMVEGVIKAWHLHAIQSDYFYVPVGLLRVGLYDLREISPTFRQSMDFLMGDGRPPAVLKIPPGVAHGCRALRGPAHLIFLNSHTYNPQDELRLPYDDPALGFDWLAEPSVA